MDRVGHTNRLQHPGGSTLHWAAAPILIVQRSRSQLFLSIRFGGATAHTEKNRDDSFMIPSNCAWRVVVSMHSSKESSRFFSLSVEAVALPNLPQTFGFGGRERSKTGYAAPPLITRYFSVQSCNIINKVTAVSYTVYHTVVAVQQSL